jgi:radical SAM protein with 4Fe4S-binding SPASM domain
MSFVMVIPEIRNAGGLAYWQYLLIALKSFVIFIAWICSFYAIKRLPVSVMGILDLSRVLFATLMGVVFLHETMKFNQIIGFCEDAQEKDLILLGGEPTIYPNIKEVLSICSQKNFRTTIVTNGIAFKNEQTLKEFYDAGMTGVDISVKASSDLEYKEVTGVAAFSDVLLAINNIHRLGKDFSCSMVITTESVDTFVEGVRTIFANGCKKVNLSFAYDFNIEENKNPNWLVENNPYSLVRRFCAHVDELNEITGGNWSMETGFPLCIYSEDQLSKMKENLMSCCQLIEGNGILFDTDLSLIPCNTMFKLKCGKLGKDFSTYNEFIDWKNNGVCKATFDALRSVPSEKCLTCPDLQYCGGGCVCFWTNCSFEDLESQKEYLKELCNNEQL